MGVLLEKYEKNLGEVAGKKVVSVAGYVSCPFDADTLVFKLTRIFFDDGSSVRVEGEHDTPYLPADEVLTEKKLKAFYEKD